MPATRVCRKKPLRIGPSSTSKESSARRGSGSLARRGRGAFAGRGPGWWALLPAGHDRHDGLEVLRRAAPAAGSFATLASNAETTLLGTALPCCRWREHREGFTLWPVVAASDRVDVLVVGAGQAGLAMARALSRLGVHHRVQERQASVGDGWRRRHDSLVLFTSREYSTLPGVPHSGDPKGFPGKAEMGQYLERYAAEMQLPVVTGDGVANLLRSAGMFLAVTDAGRGIQARAVVVATGAFQAPRVPAFAAGLSDRVLQLDAASYGSPARVPVERVLVVGHGATGRQIALELAGVCQVALAMGRPRKIVPQRIFGRDSMWWFDRAGLLRADKETRIGRWVRAADSFPGWHLRSSALQRAGVSILPRCMDGRGDEFEFADGSRRSFEAVIWALGYRDETEWLGIEGAVSGGEFAHNRGLTPVPGLFHIGREWQNSRASALICGVAEDAEGIAGHVVHHLTRRCRC